MKPEARNGTMEKILLTMKEPSAYHFQSTSLNVYLHGMRVKE